MPYKVIHRDGILDLATGNSWKYGEYIDTGGFEPERLARMVEDGVLAETPGVPSLITQITPAALKLAEQHNVDLSAVRGTGQDGRILVSDVESYIAGGVA